MKKPLFIFLFLILCLSLSGCTLPFFDSDSLMHPPSAAGDGQEIQETLNDALGTGYILRYPRSGTHRSAIIRADLDGDEVDEAVVFYRSSTDTAGTRLAIMDESEGSWNVVCQESGDGSDVDRVLFLDCTGDGCSELVIGWQSYTGSNIVAAYKYSGGALSDLSVTETTEATGVQSRLSYSELAACDIDSDGRDELFVASIDTINSESSVKMMKYAPSGAAGTLTVADEIPLDQSITGFSSSTSGEVAPGVTGIYIGTYRRGSSIATDLIVWNSKSGRMSAPFSSLPKPFLRTNDTQPEDIGEDGILKFAVDTVLPSFSHDRSEMLYLTTWLKYSPDSKEKAEKYITRLEFPDKGYSVSFPDEWIGRVTAERALDDDVVYFFGYTEEGLGNELFRIKIFSAEEWKKQPEPPEDEAQFFYRSIHSDSYNVYAVLLSTTAFQFGITNDLIESCFQPLG